MTAPVIQGWCPGAWQPMPSGDGLVVRVRPPLGRLEPAQARIIAGLAGTYGNGLIDISSRANLQLRGMRADSHEAVLAELLACDLLDSSAEQESRRNIVLTPFWQEGDAAPRLWQKLAEMLCAEYAPQLPAKFGFAIDCGPVPVLRDASADIRIESSGTGGYLVIADGTDRGTPVSETDCADVVLDLARWFAESGGAPQGRGRMRRHLVGGTPLPARFLETPRQKKLAPTGPKPGPGPAGYGVALAFGQMRAEALLALADAGPLRLTPWRMLVIEGAQAAPAIEGLITDAADPLLRVVACTGAPGCLQALQPTRAVARALATTVPDGGLLHVSGCAKGCAHPDRAPLTLTATPGGFDLVRDGTAAGAPSHFGLPPDAAQIQKVL